VNKTLTTLDVHNNRIHADGANALAEALKKNKTLTMLDVRSNSIIADGSLLRACARPDRIVLT
jgi:Ran GTPase-activating protein (RanGAP) involved in mRNA processing and transport